ncbi:hydantoinase B/oxoprolinase family protein [Celeribacter naphthalenivorans]|uniref:hydantoinase B/oxoprolinase family protein n=1 Tax=Celeribacter naphthalenivorans TaxID=1614694 RepID=UPI001CFC133B|nr:hydantoinase B/oxoprolinase family protein [Celeribacter naphthalenivorans]
MSDKIDPISRDVFQYEAVSVAEEMSMALKRSAFSSIIWDMLDYACGILDVHGNTIAQAETIPAQLGIMPTAVKRIFDVIPLSDWNEGDVIICNDPYFGCTHTLDIVLFSPVYFEGEIIAIASTVAHHIDLGGKVPGTEAADAVEIFEEGLRFPPLKVMDQGKPNETIFAMIKRNVRDPEACAGDLRAQIAGCRMGERRMKALAERYGAGRLQALIEASQDYGEAYVRAALANAERREFKTSILIEDDASSDEPMQIVVHAKIEDDYSLTVDFTGTSAQRQHGINCPVASAIGMTSYAAKVIFSPDVNQNEGCNRPLNIIIPEGCFLNPISPAAVSVRHLSQQAVGDAVLKALTPLQTKNASAGCHVSFPTFTAGGVDDRAEALTYDGEHPYFVICDIISGGMGGHRGGDGLSAIDTHGGHCAILSAEVMETMSPFRVLSTKLVPNSGGNGKFRGGLAITRDYEVLSSTLTLSGYLQQTGPETAAWGYAGGSNGAPASAELIPNGAPSEKLKSKFVGLKMRKGDVIRLTGCGGGGWGDVAQRDPDLVASDRAAGFIE